MRGWRAKVVRHLSDPLDDQAAVIVLGPDVLGDADAVMRTRLLAAHPEAAVAALAAGPSLLERAGAHALVAGRTLAKPIAPATLVDEAIDLLRRRQAAAPTIVLGLGDATLRETVRRQLDGLGTVVEAHEHGEAVWNAVTQIRPELCIIDETGAGGPALHLPRAMRREWDVAPTSIVLLTAGSDEATIARATAAGVDDWLPVAATASLLTAVVRNRLDRTSTQRLAADLDPATRLPHLRSVIATIERMVGHRPALQPRAGAGRRRGRRHSRSAGRPRTTRRSTACRNCSAAVWRAPSAPRTWWRTPRQGVSSSRRSG